jgi:hypothetical protein
MGRWTPKDNQPVGPNEHIGRRLYDEPRLFGAADQDPFAGLDLRNFEATSDRQFSVDRVGESSCNNKILKYLTPRANAAGQKFHEPKTFHGWLVVTARKLTEPQAGTRWSLAPSPDSGPIAEGEEVAWSDDNLVQNRYHAHIEIPPEIETLFFAFLAREIFRKGTVHMAFGISAKSNNPMRQNGDGVGLLQTIGVESWIAKMRRFFSHRR